MLQIGKHGLHLANEARQHAAAAGITIIIINITLILIIIVLILTLIIFIIECWAEVIGCGAGTRVLQVGQQGHHLLDEVGFAATQQAWQQTANLDVGGLKYWPTPPDGVWQQLLWPGRPMCQNVAGKPAQDITSCQHALMQKVGCIQTNCQAEATRNILVFT